MLSPVATPALPVPSPTQQPPSQHQYGTRIRSNSVIKPSARLRQPSDSPRRIKPVPGAKPKPVANTEDVQPADMPVFPPPHIMLHSDDATSKVFAAIGRSFMSVDNKAMTIKDLAEMTLKFGLMCQNVSAAGQAITTYIRNHMQRCEAQEDQPLLLRHVMSGTPSDDDLASALHSRSGGAHCMLGPDDDRLTNFRRGTMVWYLSKAAGVPCPFSRCGIRLCEYNEDGRVGTTVNPGKERKRERDRLRRAEQCGQKRKRPLRSRAAKQAEAEYSSEEERRAPKVKLTLRLKPSLVSKSSASSAASPPPSEVIDLSKFSESEDDEDDSLSDDFSEDEDEDEKPKETPWCLPPYPRYAASIPAYSPSIADTFAQTLPAASRQQSSWRSTSLPSSTMSASPPPDSGEEDAETSGDSSWRQRDGSESSWALDDEDDDEDFFADMEDTDTQWGESPGPTSPPAQFEDEGVQVKQEPRDVGGFLDAWEGLESNVTDLQLVHTSTKPSDTIAEDLFRPKLEPLDPWGWSDPFAPSSSNPTASSEAYEDLIKTEEDEEPVIPLRDLTSMSPSLSPRSTFSALPTPRTPHDFPDEAYLEVRRCSDFAWRDAEILGPDSVKPHDLENGVWQLDCKRREFKTAMEALPTPPQSPDVSTVEPPAKRAEVIDEHTAPRAFANEPTSVDSSLSSPVPDVQPSATTAAASRPSIADEQSYLAEPVVLHTCQPCVPAICATELEGISVYQMVLGSSCILRRIDTDFVNISPILQFFGVDHPSPLALPSSVIVSKGSSVVCGIWTSLPSTRDMFQSQSLLNAFLSHDLHERFPPSLRAARESTKHARAAEQFGPHFQSTADAKRESTSSFRLELPPRSMGTPWELGMVPQWDVEDHLLSVHPPFALCSASLKVASSSHDDSVVPETPLSPTEEEMFRVLCASADWEPPAPSETSSAEPPATCPDTNADLDALPKESAPALLAVMPCQDRERERDRPVRRSKRVAQAAAGNRPCTRSSKRSSRASRS